MSRYAITVDYYMWDEENDKEYTEKSYLYIKGKHKIYVFHNTPDVHEDELELKSFATRGEALTYIAAHNLNESCCYENVRVERI